MDGDAWVAREVRMPGGNMGGAARVGVTVRPPAGPWSLTIQQLLGHLRDRGLRWAPEPLGVDEHERDVVGYLPGVVPQYPLPGWTTCGAMSTCTAATRGGSRPTPTGWVLAARDGSTVDVHPRRLPCCMVRRAVPQRSAGGPGVTASPPRRRADRLDEAVQDQTGRCFWCRRAFSALVPATTDHVVPRVKGGPSWRENEVAACRRCNGQRGHVGPVEWLEECERRGWPADPHDLVATLDRLDAAIAERGGQRRARSYLQGQRSRLRHRLG